MSLTLGIDIGTTKVAVVVWDAAAAHLLTTYAAVHGAGLAGLPPGRAEQDARRLMECARELVLRVPGDLRRRITDVGVTGQMHGLVFVASDGTVASPVYTWQDRRCNDDGFIEQLRGRAGDDTLASGHGAATWAWLTCHNGVPARGRAACGVPDLLVTTLCGTSRPVTDATNAASFGLFDPVARRWRGDVCAGLGLDPGMLAEIRDCGQQVGVVSRESAKCWGLPRECTVMTPVGDNQASIWAAVHGCDPLRVLVMTIGTGAQLSAVMPDETAFAVPPGSLYELRPFPGGRYAAVAASLTGGSAVQWFLQMLDGWCGQMDVSPVPEAALLERLDSLADACPVPGPEVRPTFWGERHDAGRTGVVTGLGPTPPSLGEAYAGLTHGIVQNLVDMLPAHVRQGREVVCCTGGALSRGRALQRAARRILGLQLRVLPDREDAALGAAMLAADGPGRAGVNPVERAAGIVCEGLS